MLALGSVVLLAAIGLGERMGDRVLLQTTGSKLTSVQPVAASPDPEQSEGPYGPDWKRSDTLSAASDPRFPDPRVPPQPLPTPATPAPVVHTPAPILTPTPNANIPVWRQTGMPTPSPSPTASGAGVDTSGTALPSPAPTATVQGPNPPPP